MPTLAKFLERFPEFADNQADVILIQEMLDLAELQVDEVQLGTLYDQAWSYKAAHMLANSPFGQQARLVSDEGKTTYEEQFDQIIGLKVGGPHCA